MSLTFQNVAIQYKEKEIIENLSFSVDNGEVLGIAGINGAGKSTTLKALTGLIPTKRGYIILNGFSPSNSMQKEQFKTLLGYCPDVGGVIPSASPREHINLLMNLSHNFKDTSKVEEAYRLLETVNLKDFIDTPCGSFSHGMLRRMSVVLASLNAEQLLVLDEPFDGVDPTGINAIKDIILKHKSEGKIVIVSSHLIDVLSEVADRIIVMVDGEIKAEESGSYFSGTHGIKKYRNILGIQ